MRNPITEEVSVFTYEDWLSKTKGPKRTKVCELPAVVDDEEMVEKTTYIIQVKTSDVAGRSHMHVFFFFFVFFACSLHYCINVTEILTFSTSDIVALKSTFYVTTLLSSGYP